MCRNDQYDSVCKSEFSALHSKLDRLDEAVRGNGKPGIQTRLDRLEQDKLTRGKLGWFAVGALTTLASSVIAGWLIRILPS